jgi:preprotein translocase subunit SecD
VRRSHIVYLLSVALLALGGLVAVLAASWGPVLGVQLQGGVEVVLRPTETAEEATIDQAIEVIRSRIDAFGVAEPDITRQDQQVVIQLPGVDDQNRAVELVGQTAELQFRPVQSAFDATDPQQRATAEGLFEALSGGAIDGTGLDDLDAPSDPITATTAPAASVAANDEDSEDATSEDEAAPETTVAPTTVAPTTVVPTTVAPETTVAPTTTIFDPAAAPDVVDIVTQADSANSDDVVMYTNLDQTILYILGPAEVTGDAVSGASATFQNEWVVNVDFNPEGSERFDAMAAANFGRQVAIALDGVVYSAPTINATEFNGTAVISGTFEQEDAQDLELVLQFGALPIEFEQDDVRTVSATLGEGTLRAGIIAGLVGLGLVALYMLLYYRLLGLVAICSLLISASILWTIISVLGERKGLALTLAGATGIVVSIGVAVDSNIVYYERIKEEVRRGRAVRSAADNSFKDSFMTIIWADTASLIGALILYFLTTGSVKGFALFLGLATVIDIFVSYFFMHPLVVLMTRKFIAEQPSRIGIPPEKQVAGETV